MMMMKRHWFLLFLLLTTTSTSESVNSSVDDKAPMVVDDDGGFSTLDSILHWAIGHSNPDKLKDTVQHLSTTDLEKRQWDIKEAMEQLKTPSDAQFMQIAIADLRNHSLSSQHHLRALHELLLLVELIDNANDLNKFGGLDMVIQSLNNSEKEIRVTAAWILGKASQNNPIVQTQVIGIGALPKLMKMVQSTYVEEATKALYAVSALIRNNIDGQDLFYAEGGNTILQDIMSSHSMDIRLRRKSAFLIADLAESQLDNRNGVEPTFFSDKLFLKSVIELTTSSDLYLQEKALMAIKSLLQLKSNEDRRHFKDFCGLNEVLERMREQFQQLMMVESQRDIAMDMESLRIEVEDIFRRKVEMEPVLWLA